MKQQTNKHPLILIGLIILLLAAVAISFLLGRYPMTLHEFFTTLFSPFTGVEVDSFLENTIFQVRFPRILVAILIGSGLSVAGAAYQGTFHNPMVSPDLLGASSAVSYTHLDVYKRQAYSSR